LWHAAGNHPNVPATGRGAVPQPIRETSSWGVRGVLLGATWLLQVDPPAHENEERRLQDPPLFGCPVLAHGLHLVGGARTSQGDEEFMRQRALFVGCPHRSRRRFLQAGYGLGMAALAGRLWPDAVMAETSPDRPTVAAESSQLALQDGLLPRPLPLVDLNSEHIVAPDPGGEPSSIYDFTGMIGLARHKGTGTDGSGKPLLFGGPGQDMRFFQGTYVAVNGSTQQGTFVQV